jgi:hypothetical protein
MKIVKEKILNKESSIEYQNLLNLNSPYLVKLEKDSFYSFNEYYCFVIEYCEVF